ncbi:hypothetical protein CEXT_6411 [Caerostris extrusa]|uniref:Uncharacterized protein n=1 Tax=Caerostris extrusa TaxID=172846 RepID=A0AAV4U4U1_CAEEX|nr:hypothetical protein CEXT_6411 [Caerostris extrusa]
MEELPLAQPSRETETITFFYSARTIPDDGWFARAVKGARSPAERAASSIWKSVDFETLTSDWDPKRAGDACRRTAITRGERDKLSVLSASSPVKVRENDVEERWFCHNLLLSPSSSRQMASTKFCFGARSQQTLSRKEVDATAEWIPARAGFFCHQRYR